MPRNPLDPPILTGLSKIGRCESCGTFLLTWRECYRRCCNKCAGEVAA